MAYTFRDFAFQVYRLISASSPVIPLHGDDQQLCLQVLNQLLEYYASNGLMLTIAKTVSANINLGNDGIIFTPQDYNIVDYVPTPDLANPVQIANGRLANLNSAYLLLNGVSYPLIDKSRDEYLAAWKYNPLQGLPRFIVTFPQDDIVGARLYPAPSQFFEFVARGKFELPELTKDSDMSSVPKYYRRYLLFATAKDVAMYKGRADAWTDKLEDMYNQAKDVMESASEVNLSVTGDQQSMLNGSWAVRAGI
jgi:hypothetical protein